MKQNEHKYENLKKNKKWNQHRVLTIITLNLYYLRKFTKNVISLLQQAVTDQRKV